MIVSICDFCEVFWIDKNEFSWYSKYEKITGTKVDLEKIKKSVEIIKNSGVPYEFRTTVDPTLTKKDFLEISKWLKDTRAYYIQQFRPNNTLNPKLTKEKPTSDEFLEEIHKAVKKNFKICEIRKSV